MLQKLRSAGLIAPTIAALVALGVLIALGTWQMQRKAWKEGLLAQIAARTKAPPVPLAQALEEWRAGDVEYRHVRVTGRFAHDREGYVYTVDERLGQGFNVYTPLLTDSGRLVLINRGFVPEALRDPARRAGGQIAGEVTVTGLARKPTPAGAFTPPSDVAKRQFYWPDYAGLLQVAAAGGGGAAEGGGGGAAAGKAEAVPFFVDADAEPANPGGFPRGGTTRLTLYNRHLEYAVTWYGLALTLIGVYFAFARGRLRGAGSAG